MSNARVFVALSAIDGMMVVTNPVERSVVSISQDASAAIPPVPSFFSDIPTPTPIAKRDCHIVDQSSACFNQKQTDQIGCAMNVSTLHSCRT